MDDETNFDILKEKLDAGADFIVTQLFYDTGRFLKWLENVRRRGMSISHLCHNIFTRNAQVSMCPLYLA